jgi:hypothetical protein
LLGTVELLEIYAGYSIAAFPIRNE